MNISGFALVYFMRGQQKVALNNTVQRKAQGEWLKLMPKKLFMSLTLTPLTDRLLMAIFNVQRPKEGSVDDAYDAQEVVEGGVTKAQRLESVEQLIVFFKFMMVIAIYFYSSYQKWLRESNNNF